MQAAVLNKKIDEHKKPLKYISIVGIILTILAFLMMLYLLLHLLFNLVLGILGFFKAPHLNASANAALHQNAFNNASSTEALGSFYKIHAAQAEPAYAQKVTAVSPHAKGIKAGFVRAEGSNSSCGCY
jgi:ABC-type bacteriocin/lantibiotic exporter with double-glycine peptidase domain